MPEALLFIELGAVILGLAVLARVAGHAGFSPIPLYLVAGLAFGEGGLLPLVTAEEFIEVGAEIGVILLLLMLGLEYTGEELTDSLRRHAPAGMLNVVLNFTPGFLAAILLGWGPMVGVFLGGITYMSSSGIVARMLQELGWLGNREAPAVLSILVFEDLTMAVYLPVVAVILLGGPPGAGLLAVAVAVVTVAAVLFVAVRYGPALSRTVFSRSDEGMLLTILGVVLLVAGLAERVQVSAAIGAFLVGIALSGPAADRARTLLTPLRDLFAAVFFIFFGLRVAPANIPPVLGAAALLALVTLLTKLVVGWWSAGGLGAGSRGRLRAGFSLGARGEFSVVIAGLAVVAGLEPQLGPLTAAYVLLLATAGPVGAQLVDPIGARIVRRREARGAPGGG